MKKKSVTQATFVPMSETPFTSRKYGGTTALVQLTHPHAQVPNKTNDQDIGFDLQLVERCDGRTEDLVGDVTMFNSGIVIKPPEGWYFEIHARSSLHKHGYMLANGVGIIDPEYRGNIFVPLLKFRDGDDIKVPIRAVQLVPRRAEYLYVGQTDEQISEEDTPRGRGGFGSTEDYEGHSLVTLDRSKGKEKTKAPAQRKRPGRATGGGLMFS